MKKIIIPFDGNHFSSGAFSFARSLDKINPILLTGIFLPQVDYSRFFLFPTAFSGAYVPVLEDFNEADIENTIQTFSKLCIKNSIEYKVHKDLLKNPIIQLTKETRFADLMIIGGETFYKSASNYGMHEYLKGALHNTECPVIIVPENFNFPSQIILAYDGSEASVFAIRQFVCLFPELCKLKTILFYAGDDKHIVPDKVLIEEFAARHFSDLTTTKLNSDRKNDLNNWFHEHEDSLIVSGSFGRSDLSELFRSSFVVNLIKEYKTPVFIAHR